MNCSNWLGLFWCVVLCVVFGSDAVRNVLSRCTKTSSHAGRVGLDCRNLQYQFIPPEILGTNVKRIYLSSNPYVCNCGLLWFLNALHGKSLTVKIVDLDQVTCAKPENLNGRLVKDLKKIDVCGKLLPCKGVFCSVHAQCVEGNSAGGITKKCVCNPGFAGNGTFCQDVDECSLGDHDCRAYEDCDNKIGSFQCRCKSGLKVNSKGGCDVKEPCETMARPCDSSTEVCVDKQRGYECACKTGFYKNSDTNRCTDVNECEQRHICSTQAMCINKIGSYQCVCNYGYVVKGKVCEDVDECETGKYHCPDNTVCFNTVGGYKCVCKPGYKKAENGKEACTEVDTSEEKNKIIIYGVAAAGVLLIFMVCCCCCCCCRKSKKEEKGSKEKLIDEANQDLLNLALEADALLLQQQQVEQQMYILGMQQQQAYVPYYDNAGVMPPKGVRPNDSSMTTWSEDEEGDYAETTADYDYAYN